MAAINALNVPGLPSLASGTDNAPGGLTLVNDGKGPEIIVENGVARIVGNGKPALTILQKGATVFNAEETRKIFQNSGIPALEGGTVKGIQRPGNTPSGNNSGGNNNNSGGGSNNYTPPAAETPQNTDTGTSEEDIKNRLEWLKEAVELQKSGLKLSQAREESYEAQIAQTEQILIALRNQIEYMKETGQSQTEINNLEAEYEETLRSIDELRLKEKEDTVSLLESELKILEAENAPLSERIAKQKEIANAMEQQITLMWEQGANQEDINDAVAEWKELKQDILDMELEEKENTTALLQSQLELLQAQDKSVKSQILKQREIYKALGEEIKAMKAAGRSQEEINKKKKEQLEVEKNIKEIEQGLYDRLTTAAQNKIDKINEKRDKELEKLKKAYDIQQKTNELEEKKLAVEEAREKLANARAERNVRVYNAAKGEWEWVANAKDVDSAKKELQDAKDALAEYKKQQKYDAQVEKINAKYDAQVEQWQKIIDYLKEPAESLGKVLRDIAKNADKAMRTTINGLNRILRPTGYHIDTGGLYDSGGILQGIGGIKGTNEDEMILPPDLTKAMLTPITSEMFNARLDELKYLYGATTGMRANIGTSVGKQINGNVYQYGNITLSESEAKHTTVYELANMARGLRSYVATSK